MPRATIADMKEMVKFGRQWRVGKLAFKDLFDDLPKEAGAVYNKFNMKEEPDLLNLIALDACNEAWAADEARRQTKALRKEVNAKIRKIRATAEYPAARRRKESRALRRELNTKARTTREDILERGGMLASIDDADKASKAYNAKVFMVLCLGKFIDEQGPSAMEELNKIMESAA